MKKSAAPRRRLPIDWEAVHHRLNRLEAAVARGWKPDADEQRRILEIRTQALARPLPASSAEERVEVVEFSLAGERYGFVSAFVREVLHLTQLTRLPGVPAFVLGIINVRGEIVSVIDLKRLFELPDKSLTERDRVLILHSGDVCFGVLADRIVGVRSVAQAAIQPFLPARHEKDYLLGIIEDRLALLDGARLLADRRLVVHETVAE